MLSVVMLCLRMILSENRYPLFRIMLSALIENLLLRAPDHVLEAVPDPIGKSRHAVDIGVARQRHGDAVLRRAAALRRGRLGHRTGRQWQAAREDLLLQRGVLGAQPRDLVFQNRAIFGRSYAAEPDILIEQLREDEAIAEADTLLLTIPNQLGVAYNAHVMEAILTTVAPALGWR